MKRIIIQVAIALSVVGTWSCQDIDVGYLITEYASYGLDSLVVRKDLDAAPPGQILNPDIDATIEAYLQLMPGYTYEQMYELLVGGGIIPEYIPTEAGSDYERVKYNIPWVSTPIEGVEGSEPIFCTIKSVTSAGGNAAKLLECLTVRGDGTLEVPLENDVPPGRYSISLNFTNEGWSKDVDDCFTIIVK